MKELGRGFTLIELLIVIAIILILIAIALPNFLEAQIRAKVTKTKANARTIAVAMDSYLLDFKVYPTDHDWDDLSENGLNQLTTPIQYLKEIPDEPFSTANGLREGHSDEIGWEMGSSGPGPHMPSFAWPKIHAFALFSFGPNVTDDFPCSDAWPTCTTTPQVDPCLGDGGGAKGGRAWWTYNPTNGTKSYGDIVQTGGEVRSGNYCIDGWLRVRGFFDTRT